MICCQSYNMWHFSAKVESCHNVNIASVSALSLDPPLRVWFAQEFSFLHHIPLYCLLLLFLSRVPFFSQSVLLYARLSFSLYIFSLSSFSPLFLLTHLLLCAIPYIIHYIFFFLHSVLFPFFILPFCTSLLSFCSLSHPAQWRLALMGVSLFTHSLWY